MKIIGLPTLSPIKVHFLINYEAHEAPSLYDDPLVTVKIAHYEVRRVLIDNGNSLNLFYLTSLINIGIYHLEIVPREMPLLRFNGSTTISIGTIRSLVSTTGVIVFTNFIVSNTLTSYNVILGRLWLHKIQEIPSILHQLVKYPTIKDIKEIQGD